MDTWLGFLPLIPLSIMVSLWSLSITVFHITRLASNSVALFYWLDQGWTDDPGWTNQPFLWGFRIWITRAHSCFLFLSLLALLGLRPRKEAEEAEPRRPKEPSALSVAEERVQGRMQEIPLAWAPEPSRGSPALAWHAHTGESWLGVACSPKVIVLCYHILCLAVESEFSSCICGPENTLLLSNRLLPF